MRFTMPIALVLFASASLRLPAATAALRTAADVDVFTRGAFGSSATFTLTGVVQRVSRNSFIVQDASGRTLIYGSSGRFDLSPGDEVALRGHVSISALGEPWSAADACAVIGSKPTAQPFHVAISDLDENRHHLAAVIVEGTVIRAFDDEIDNNYQFLILKDEGAILPVALRHDTGLVANALIGARVQINGTFHRTVNGFRRFCGPFLDVADSSLLTVTQQAPSDPFDAPPLEARRYLTPREVSRLGRRTVYGLVAAVWRGNQLMLREPNGRIVNVELTDDTPLPVCGAWGMAVGYPETDLFRLNLSNAWFRDMPAASCTDDERPIDVTPDQIMADKIYRHDADLYHGKLVRLTGIVRSVPSESHADARLILDCDGQRASVDLSADQLPADQLPIGCTVQVTGRCLLETENWRNDNVFPRIRDFAVIPRTAADLRIVAHPPWWTPGRLLAVIGVLAALFVAVFVWNETLRRQVRRRSRELLKSRIANMKADIRISERNRLAVELHDTVSQNIAGASMRIDAAGAYFEHDPAKALECLKGASRTLVSCREELRNFIWDLRNRILDEPRVDEAIRKTVQPYLNGTRLSVRFDVPRTRLSDNTLHTILCCIRELVSNAVRHGHASAVSVAGTRDGDRIGFSVSDNGCGFDPADRPGVAQGHFGLQGIGERVRAANGEMRTDSTPGEGTKVTIWITSQF